MKIEFQDLERAKESAETVGLLTEQATQDAAKDTSVFQTLHTTDPNLALAGLRIELEKRLRALADVNDIHEQKYGIKRLLAALVAKNAITSAEEAVLSQLTDLLNSAVHGAIVDRRAASWAAEVGPALLARLDRLAD